MLGGCPDHQPCACPRRCSPPLPRPSDPSLTFSRPLHSFIEASVSPGFVAVTRKWYTREEQTVRLGVW
jgi:hypothetical protein